MSDEENKKPEDATAQKAEAEKSTKKSKWTSRVKRSKVVNKKRGKGLYVIGTIVGVGVVLFLMTISNKHHKKIDEQTQTTTPNANNQVFNQNANRIDKLRDAGNSRNNNVTNFHLPNIGGSQSDKALKVRRNAPTQVYVAGSASVNTGTNSTAQSGLAGHGQFAQFANSQARSPSVVTATKIKHPYYTVAEGEFIAATLETAINSDLPGMVRATITRPVYAYEGENPLIPAGSRLIGQYSALSSNGAASARVFVIWNRIVTPKGLSIMINSPSTDRLGRAGQGADAIDTHFFKIFGTAALLSIRGATAANTGVDSSTQPNSANQYQQAISAAFATAAQSSLSQNLNIKPTLHVHQGDSINVFVAHDLDLYSVMRA